MPVGASVAAVFNHTPLEFSVIIIKQKTHQTKPQLDLQCPLVGLTQDQKITDLINAYRAKYDQQYAVNQKISPLIGHIPAASLTYFTSQHEYPLASITLILEAGPYLQC